MVDSGRNGTTPDGQADLPSSPRSQAGYWIAARVELEAWMRRYAPSLADLYVAAVTLLFDSPVPGRVVLISHAVREICNRLPERVSGVNGDGRLDYTSRMDKLARLWTRDGRIGVAGVPLDPAAGPPASGIRTSVDVALSPDVYADIANLVQDHFRARERPNEAAKRLFEAATEGDGPLSGAVVRQWLTTSKWFAGHAHDSGKTDGEFKEEELRAQFELFEHYLFAVSRGFYSILDELDEILAAANA